MAVALRLTSDLRLTPREHMSGLQSRVLHRSQSALSTEARRQRDSSLAVARSALTPWPRLPHVQPCHIVYTTCKPHSWNTPHRETLKYSYISVLYSIVKFCLSNHNWVVIIYYLADQFSVAREIKL